MRRIASRDNAHYKALLKIFRSGRERRKSDRVLLDGMHLIEAYGRHCGPPEELLISDSGASRHENASYLALRSAVTGVTFLADALFDDLAMVASPSGIMAIVRRPRPASSPVDDADAVLLDGIQDPGNVGSILRSAAAAGCCQALLSADCAQAWSPKTLRAAMGAHFQLDIHEACDLPAFLAGYRGHSVAAVLAGSSSLHTADLGRPLAWVFGSEGLGVRSAVLAATDLQLRIPMPGASESLNVAAAAAICLFETVRRRQTSEPPLANDRS